MRSRPLAGRLSSLAALATALTAVFAVLAPAALAQAACPNADVRAQQRSEFLPDCRAYELVSEADKGAYAVILLNQRGDGLGLTGASNDGDGALYWTFGNFADAEGGMQIQYRARRGPTGWRSESVTPPPKVPYPDWFMAANAWSMATPDLSTGTTATYDRLDPADVADTRDIYRTGPRGAAELLSRGNGQERIVPSDQGEDVISDAISDDGAHVLFSTPSHLVPADAARTASRDVYDRFESHTYLLNQDDEGNLINRCGSELAGGERAVSDDGSRIFFHAPRNPGLGASEPDCAEPRRLFMRVNHEQTVEISASQRSTPDPNPFTGASYLGASTDGSVVFFFSYNRLTDDAAGGGAYRYTVATGQLDQVLGEFADVRAVSPDGSRLYYESPFVDAPGGVFGDKNLYTWSDGEGTVTVATAPGFSSLTKLVTVTPDGRHLLFGSSLPITGFPNNGFVEVFLYDADAREVTCVSCDPAGQRPAGSVATSDAGFAGIEGRDPAISDDGEVVAFESEDRLVPDDVNGKRDVYVYRDGRVWLVTTGRGEGHSQMVGGDASGRNVFFASPESLVGADRVPGSIDIYTARLNGGFLEDEPAPVTPCSGDGCQGGTAAGPPAATLGSLGLRSAGDAKPGKRCGAGKRRVTAGGKVRCVKRCGKGRRAVRAKGKTRCVKPARKSKARKPARRATAPSSDPRKVR